MLTGYLIGYRHLPLYDLQGEQFLFSTIFVKVNINPLTVIDREAPVKASTLDTIRNTAKSVLSRGFSSDRRSVKNKNNIHDKDKSKDGGPHPVLAPTMRKTR